MPIPPELNGKKVRAAVTVVLFDDETVGLDVHGGPSLTFAHGVLTKGVRWIEQTEMATLVIGKVR